MHRLTSVLASRCGRRAAARPPGLPTQSRGHGGTPRPDHLTRTAGEPREDCISDAKIVRIQQETPTIKELHLEVSDANFTFKAGNWVDFFIPKMEKVGGYSICSVPADLPSLRLAVKQSSHPPAAWCHSDAASGASVQVKAGGIFCWDPNGDAERAAEHLVLVAGGIGINPLYSIAQEVLATPVAKLPKLHKISLLYSAATPEELVYRQHLEDLAVKDCRLHLRLHVTRSSVDDWAGCTGRIDTSVLQDAFNQEPQDLKQLCYVCGPPAMTDALVESLQGPLGLPSEAVRVERWW